MKSSQNTKLEMNILELAAKGSRCIGIQPCADAPKIPSGAADFRLGLDVVSRNWASCRKQKSPNRIRFALSINAGANRIGSSIEYE
jgi:hypothetical protein